MRPEARKFLWDALQAEARIARFTAGKTLDDYAREDGVTSAAIEELPGIVVFRNVLIHGYAVVDDRIVWGIVEGNLAALRRKLRSLLDRR